MDAKLFDDIRREKAGLARQEKQEIEVDVPLLALGACAWYFVKPVYALDIEKGAEPVQSFGYVYLGIKSEFSPGSFTIHFKDGDEHWLVTVTGRNLRPVFDRIQEHRMRRIRQTDRDFPADGDKEPVITGITVTPVEEAD